MTRNERLAAADHEAAEDALAVGPEALMAGAADGEAGTLVLADLLAHELAASHRLMLRIAAAANNLLDWRADNADAPAAAEADLAAARLAGTASRVMEQMRQGVVALNRVRPDLVADEMWAAYGWLDGEDPEEALQRRVAAAGAAQAANDASPALSPRALHIRALAAEDAAELATEARAGALAEAASHAQAGTAFLARLLAHQLGAGHALMMRITGSAHRALDRAATAAVEPTDALRLAGIAVRLGDRFRRGTLTLATLAAGSNDKPRTPPAMPWDLPDSEPADAPANDSSAALPAPVTAGHGVLRSDLHRVGTRRARPPMTCIATTTSLGVARAGAARPDGGPSDRSSTAGHGVHRPESKRRAA